VHRPRIFRSTIVTYGSFRLVRPTSWTRPLRAPECWFGWAKALMLSRNFRPPQPSEIRTLKSGTLGLTAPCER
jgi:hypothetical protein